MFEKIISAISLVGALYPIITGTIREVESSQAAGEEKKNAVIEVLKVVLDGVGKTFPTLNLPTSLVLTVASFAIDGVVAAYNIVKMFHHKEG